MGTEVIIEEKIAENFLKLLKDTYTQIQEVYFKTVYKKERKKEKKKKRNLHLDILQGSYREPKTQRRILRAARERKREDYF